MNGGRSVVEALRAAGVEHAFCVPGESFLPILDELRDSDIRVVATRHESGAAFMAEAIGKLTGRPALCMGSRAPGAANLSIGVHTANEDGTPMLAVLGQVPTKERHRHAFQEADLARVFGPISKFAVEVPDADQLGELTLQAARIAVSGRPGPAVVVLREDLLDQEIDEFRPEPIWPPRAGADADSVSATLTLLREAHSPVIFLGGGGMRGPDATREWVRVAERFAVPVIAAWRRADAFPNDHPLYLGQSGFGAPPSVMSRLVEADVILAVGAPLGQVSTSGHVVPAPHTRLVYVDGAPDPTVTTHAGDVVAIADPTLFARALLELAEARGVPAPLPGRGDRNTRERAIWVDETTPRASSPARGYADCATIATQLRHLLTPDTIVTCDAGAFSTWVNRFLRWQKPGTFLAPSSGAMGYAIPAAVAAKLLRPTAPVVAFVGDGGFLMTGNEIETAVRCGVAFVVVVFDNRRYGTIWQHQQRRYPGRSVATELGAVDFARLASALGAAGMTVDDAAAFPAAFSAALRNSVPTVIHLRVDPDQILESD